MSTKRLILAGLLISALIAGVVSLFASSNPDGLEKVAEDTGFADTAKENANADSLFADYGVSVFGDSSLGQSLAGIVGVLVTGLIAWGLFALLRKKNHE
jgi:cobalt/nickel transport protein